MTRDDIYESDRGEREIYVKAGEDAEIPLPLTKDGFESLLAESAKIYNLPVDDMMRLVVVAHVHHLSNESRTTTLNQMATLMYKSVSNSTTWKIGEEIKEKNRLIAEKTKKEAIAEANKIRENVVELKP